MKQKKSENNADGRFRYVIVIIVALIVSGAFIILALFGGQNQITTSIHNPNFLKKE